MTRRELFAKVCGLAALPLLPLLPTPKTNIFDCHIQEIKVSTDFNRSYINELGKASPYMRYASFPIHPILNPARSVG